VTADRLPAHPAQRIDPLRRVAFEFAGRPHEAFAGDTIGSALYAAGVRIFSRSFKYHRPRGLLCCAGRCPNCLVNVDGVPNVRACVQEVRPAMRVRPQHAWPSLEWDALRVFDRLHRLLPVGFYYKTFIHPRALWPTYEHVLRTFAGLGELPGFDEPEGEYDREHVFADIAVVGGGPAGMAAALEAARGGARVVLIDDQARLGGRWPITVRAGDATATVADLVSAIAAEPGVRVLGDATAFGLYESELLGVLQGRRFVKVRSSRVVVATGQFDYPMVFENNDLPGVMLASGAARLQALYGVRAGQRALVVATGDAGLESALELAACGTQVVAVADARAADDSPLTAALRQAKIPLLSASTILRATGGHRVESAVVGAVGDGGRPCTLDCDLIVLATGIEPAAGLLGHAGGRLRIDSDGRMVPTSLPPTVLAAGEVAGTRGLTAVVSSGRRAGIEAALSLGIGDGALRTRLDAMARDTDVAEEGGHDVAPGDPRTGSKRFVCLCEDVTEKDVRQAVAEGFDGIELLKRYTTVTMGPCQGKMCHRLSIDICASATGRSVEETGTTTARPPAQPVPLGALAAGLHEPVKRTPMHHLHVAAGAQLMDMGAWRRPLVYTSVDEECRAVRETVGLIDVGTLGKLDLKGRDAAAFLDWLHPNRFSDMASGRARYRVMCDDAGIILDDGVVARLKGDHFLVTTATGTIDAMEQWFEWWLAGGDRCAHLANVTGALAAVNVAGPRARDLLAPLTDIDLAPGAFTYMAVKEGRVAGVPSTVVRLGFVGELAYEIYVPADDGEHLWEALMDAGRSLGIRAFGVEAQRVLRLEKGHVIVSQDTDALTSPFEIGLGGLVKLEKPDFIGRDALRRIAGTGTGQRLVGFELTATTAVPGATPVPGATTPVPGEATLVPAEGAAVVAGGRPIGRVTSAKWSPTLQRVIGMAWIPRDHGAVFEVRVDGGMRTAKVVEGAFYDPDGVRLRS
jgi:sarcosine oxidase subunit alpha